MLFTHITQDCITKQYVKVAKQALRPIVHEMVEQKVSQPSASLQTTAPFKFFKD